jgi:hypothetical protein
VIAPIRSRVQVRAADSEGHVLPMARFMDLTYDPFEPYAISLKDPAAGELVFARELLDCVLSHGAAGDGDVHLRLACQRVTMLLVERAGACPLALKPGSAAAFLARTYELVPAGHEDRYIDLERELSQLLDPAA